MEERADPLGAPLGCCRGKCGTGVGCLCARCACGNGGLSSGARRTWRFFLHSTFLAGLQLAGMVRTCSRARGSQMRAPRACGDGPAPSDHDRKSPPLQGWLTAEKL